MRLYDRIMRDGLDVPRREHDTSPTRLSVDHVPSDVSGAKIKVIADDGLHLYHGDPDPRFGFGDMGVVKPPYESMWMEGNMPELSYFDDGAHNTRGEQFGYIVADSGEHAALTFFIYRRSMPRPGMVPMVFFFPYMPDGTPNFDGNVSIQPYPIKGEVYGDWQSAAREEQAGAWVSFATPAFYMLSLMNCKNVKVEDVPRSEKLAKAHKKRHGVPLSRFSKIVLPNQRNGGGNGHGGGGESAQHLVRGHFKTYTEDAPLMGRHTGTYWWSWHARGNAALGEVTPEYHVG